LRCRLWAERTLQERDAVQPDLAAARRHLEVLGMYNNAVHQAADHPIMREQISRPVYELFLDSPSRKEWARRYTRQGLTMFKDAHFEPIRWTTLWPGSPPG
jgi:hypothetical protein